MGLWGLLVFSLLLVLSCSQQTTFVWPHPASVVSGPPGSSIAVSPDFTFQLVNGTESSALLGRAMARYESIVFPFGRLPVSPNLDGSASLYGLQISASSVDDHLALGVSEEYTLVVPARAGMASLSARTIFGLLRGLETFAQIVRFDSDSAQYLIRSTPLLIEDEPRFPWRGLLIDTSRHYLQLSTIFRTLDAMSYNKFNVLHWHAVDTQSFPIVSRAYPRLSSEGAWAPEYVYTAEDIASVVDYAKDRGIRVLPEFDVPGHTRSWGKGHPELMADCPLLPFWRHALDPTKNFTYELIENLYMELRDTYTDDYFHVGGDEVLYLCWAADPEIREWMDANGVGSYLDLFEMFFYRVENILKKTEKVLVAWDEVFVEGIPLDRDRSVVQVWRDKATLTASVKAGYRSLLSAGWYLDMQRPTPTSDHYFLMDTWKDFYRNEPFSDPNLSETDKQNVLGGEACMWGEQVDDSSVDGRLWPRASAVAERLWSPPAGLIDDTIAQVRLSVMTCLLAERGIASGPVMPGPPCRHFLNLLARSPGQLTDALLDNCEEPS
jgi:hexosaminidase